MQSGRKINLLLIEDEAYDVQRVRQTLRMHQDQIILQNVVSDGADAIKLVSEMAGHFDVVVMDYQIAGGLSGEHLIRRIKDIDPTIQIIVITKRTININDFDFANRLIEAGAMWYCTKYPGDIEDYIYQPTDFILNIINAFEKRQLEMAKNRSHQRLNQNIDDILKTRQIVGESEPIRELRRKIDQCANLEATVLIRGASGTGKELVAANIHFRSPRRLEKFVAINCGSLPADLIESELFGFQRGSFTGATSAKPGLFEIADKGTIFLDEIAELPLSAQVKLLRVLQDGEIDKIGRTGPVKVDTRIIAATNKILEDEVRQGRFREDLYYRLNVVSINVPTLKERQSDIPLLTDHFLKKFSSKMSCRIPDINPDALQVLVEHPWQGNVRQLENVVQRLLFEGRSPIDIGIVRNALGIQLNLGRRGKMKWDPKSIIPLREMERNTRYQYFQFVRENTNSDAEAARKLGLAPPNYHRMCKELGLK